MLFLVVLTLSACMDEGVYRAHYGEPQVIGRDAKSVQVRAGFNVDPRPTAEAQCGGPARLERTERTDRAGHYSIYWFACS